ncbi:MAG: hypothetical protein EAX86_08310 [Candidatus Heimdallarchaeota archaeon]|nr:hypothetical protein [Candidatus Heimdallarchaeota archaeon]
MASHPKMGQISVLMDRLKIRLLLETDVECLRHFTHWPRIVIYNGGDSPYTQYPILEIKPLETYPELSAIEIIYAGVKRFKTMKA